ncbi:MAG: BON domain-containing protein, partial [Bacteroidota bacterium]
MFRPIFILFLISLFFPLSGNAQIDDADISERIEWEFAIQRGVSPTDIDVQTEDGIVTLSGTSSTLLAKKRAIDIAQEVRGVVAVVDHMQLIIDPISNDQIAADLAARFRKNTALEDYEIDIAVDDGLVSLSGVVESHFERELAGIITRNLPGVKDLHNGLRVYIPEIRPDIEIKTGVAERLRWDINVDDQLIDVAADEGTIHLSGVVGSLRERNNAYETAWIAGVREVDTTSLRIEYWAKDDALRKGE